MIWSAEVMQLVARRAAEFGVEIDGTVRFNLQKAVARKDGIVRGILDGIYQGLNGKKDSIRFLRGEARFLNDHEIDTGERRLSFDKAIIATGARNSHPSIPGLEGVGYLTNRTALHLKERPGRMVVIGGGYIGIEFAQMYSRFGSDVTLLGRNPQLAPGEDPELAALLANYLRQEGIDVRTAAPVVQMQQKGTEKIVTAQIDGRKVDFVGDAVLVAAGRIGNTDALNLADAGIATTAEGGFIQVDEELRSSQPHIWAIGDVKGGWMFTHVATYDGPIAALNAVKDIGRKVDYRVVPRVIFSSPSFAAVGLTEERARALGHEIKVGVVDADGGRSKAIGDTRGKLKAVVNAADGEILGYHVLAPHADDLLHEAVVAMHDHGRIDRIGRSIHVHPTLSELVKSAARAAR